MKHCREVLRRLEKEVPGIQVTLLRQCRHLIYEIRLGDVSRHLAVSKSPTNVDHTIKNAVKEAKQLLGLPK